MTQSEKIVMLKTLLELSGTDEDERLAVYLSASEKEILSWRYSYASEIPTEVPSEYEMTQIHAVIAGYAMIGVENQTEDQEGVVTRKFKYDDMIAYIRSHVIPIARCI